MGADDALIKKITKVIGGLRVEDWLRLSVIRSILSTRFLPNANGEITEAVNALDEKERHRFILLLSNALSRTSAQADFMGVIGVPLGIGLITVVATFGVSVFAIIFFFLILLGYLFIYFYYRLMKAAIESILRSLRIDFEYRHFPANY